jgi:chromosome segregation ATPase
MEALYIAIAVITYLLYKIHQIESRLNVNDSGFKYQETHNEDIKNYIDQLLTWTGYEDDETVFKVGLQTYVERKGSLHDRLKKLEGMDSGILDMAYEIGEIKKRLDSLETQVESNEDESILMNGKIDDIQSQLDTHEDELERLHRDDNSLRQKISSWLNNPDNNEGDLVDFLVDECGIELKEDE